MSKKKSKKNKPESKPDATAAMEAKATDAGYDQLAKGWIGTETTTPAATAPATDERIGAVKSEVFTDAERAERVAQHKKPWHGLTPGGPAALDNDALVQLAEKEITPEPTTTPTAESKPDATAELAKAVLAKAIAEVNQKKAEYDAARKALAILKKGPTGPTTALDGTPLTAGQKAWNTRVARGFQPKAKSAKPTYDPNNPNLTAGQKAYLTRLARQSDPNYVPPTKKAPKPDPQAHMNAALAAAFPAPPAGEQFEGGTRVAL